MLNKGLFSSKTITLLAVIVCFVYILIMMQLLFNRVGGGFNWNTYRYNIVPFRTINNYIVNYSRFNFETWFKNLFGNIVLFIPIGVFAPILNRRYLRLVPFFYLAFGLLLTVELIQLVTKVGSFDVDDLILNLLGATLGLLVMKWG